MHFGLHQPPGQQVGSAPPQLAGAGTGENETALAVGFHQLLDDIEQGRRFLDFINHDVARSGMAGHQFAQPFGAGLVQALALRVEQVHPDGIRVVRVQPG